MHIFKYSVGSCQVSENVSRLRCFYIQQAWFSELQSQMHVTSVAAGTGYGEDNYENPRKVYGTSLTVETWCTNMTPDREWTSGQ